MGVQVEDRVECLECGRWFRSVANHVFPAHGMTSHEYRIAHRLPMSDSLQGADTTQKRREIAFERMERDPGHIRRLRDRRVEEGNSGEISPEVREVMRERRQVAEAEKWSARLASRGWSSWQDAADWVIDRNVSWVEVGELWGVSLNAVWSQARAAGVEHLDKRMTDHQREMVAMAETRMAEMGTLRNASPAVLSSWLSNQRQFAQKGRRLRVHAELDRIDPGWAVPPKLRMNPPCSVAGCEEPRAADGLCRIHYGRRVHKQLRDAVSAPEEQLECLECGDRFRSVATHAWQVHGLSAEAYRAKHGLEESVGLAEDKIRDRRRELASRPADRERFVAVQQARWGGGSAEERWRRAFERCGWSGWADAVEWALAENVGYPEIADRLGYAESKVRAYAKEAETELLPALTPAQLEALDLARIHAEAYGDLAHPRPPKLARWLESRRTLYRVNGVRSRADAILDELDPDWWQPQATRPNPECAADGCTKSAGTSGWCKHHLEVEYRSRRKAEAAVAMGLPADTTEHLGQVKQKAQAARDWAARFAACGWTGWPDAIAWALETNSGWGDLAGRLGVSQDFAYRVAKQDGFEMYKPVRAVSWRMLQRAAAHVAAHGDLVGLDDQDFLDWLDKRRTAVDQGKKGRVADRLDQLDPGWKSWVAARVPGEKRLPPQNRPRPEPPECAADGCTERSKAKGLCMRHYDQARKGTRKAKPQGIFSEVPVPDRVQCLECGLWLKSVAIHVSSAHGLKVAAYRAKHGLSDDVALVGAATAKRLSANRAGRAPREG